MDPTRFDAMSRSFAERSTRRAAIRGLGGGGLAAGLLAVVGLRSSDALAATTTTCDLAFTGTVAAGVDDKTAIPSALSLPIGADGAIDAGTLTLGQGGKLAVVGQAVGRALSLRVDFGGGKTMALTGTGENDISKCTGRIDGTFGGPDVTDFGTWTAAAKKALGGGTGGGTKPTPTPVPGGTGSGGSTGGSKPTPSSGGTGGGTSGGGNPNCASGVVCGGVCCTPPAGYGPPDAMSCDAQQACACRYSCQAAGCPYGGTDHFVRGVYCTDTPDAQCSEDCNYGPDTGCGNMTCASGTTLDVNSCTCLPDSGGGACTGTFVPCGGKCVPSCEFGGTLDPTTCKCVAPSGGSASPVYCGSTTCAPFGTYAVSSMACQGDVCTCQYRCSDICAGGNASTYIGTACDGDPSLLCQSMGCMA
ncbi:MAG: hypothetical protein ACR2OO_12180 [Thermomicrobiales bacterium]